MKTPLKIAEKKNISFGISIAIIVAGLVMALISGINFGIDFTGGTLMQIDVGRVLPVSEVKEITDKFDPQASIVHAGEDQHEIIIKTTQDITGTERLTIFNEFKEKYNLEDEALLKTDKVGASIGRELRLNALMAMLIAAVGMLIYVSFRFEWRFGVAAIIALIHDVLVVMAFYIIAKIPINGSFVAAMLTIVGYSINDTIVLFDKIRENLKISRKVSYAELVDISVTQTLTRSINTSATTLITVGTLYVLGVDDIRHFALPLIVGVLSGTYSSIFIASPIWMMLRNVAKKVRTN